MNRHNNLQIKFSKKLASGLSYTCLQNPKQVWMCKVPQDSCPYLPI